MPVTLYRLPHYLAYDETSRNLRIQICTLDKMLSAVTATEVRELFSAHDYAFSVFSVFEIDNNSSPRRESVFRRRLFASAQRSIASASTRLESILASDSFKTQCLSELKLLTLPLPACHSEHDGKHDDIVVFEVASGFKAQHSCVLMYFRAANLADRTDDWLLVSAPYWAFCEFYKLLLASAYLDAPPLICDMVIDLRNGPWPRPSDTVLAAAIRLWEPELPDSCYRTFDAAIVAAEILV